MKKISIILVLAIILNIIPAYASAAEKQEIVIHVSVKGNDMNPGTEEKPVATVEGAKAIVRKLPKEQPITVLIHGGEYRISKTIEFAESDSGTKEFPIVYKAAGDGEVIFNGSTKIDINQFEKVTDKDILSRLPASAVGRVGQLNLSSQGITLNQVIPINNDGVSPDTKFVTPNALYFYLNDREQNMARWPNRNFASIGNVLSTYSFEYTETNPSNWTKAKYAYITGYLYLEYAGGWAKLSRVDKENRSITINGGEGVKANHRWSAVNLIEELDIPGEWYVDRDTMILYYYPEKLLNPQKDVMELPTLRTPFIKGNFCSNIVLDGLTFAKNYSHGIQFLKGNNITVRNCIVRDIGGTGILFNECKDALIENNTISNTSVHNINYSYYPYGGYPQDEIDNLIPTGGVIRNNHCYNAGNNNIGMVGNVAFGGLGTIVENNTVHKGINSGIIGTNIDTVVRYNEVYNMVRETADAGALYCGRTWTLYGPVIEYNYIHDLGDKEFNAGNLVDCIFWDDTISGQTARFNILRPNSKTRTYGVISGGGRDNTVTHNIIIDSDQSIGMQDRTTTLPDVRSSYQNGTLWQSLTSVATSNTAYIKKYPQMARTYKELNETGIFYPHYNNVSNNVIVNALPINYSNTVKNSETSILKGNYEGKDYSIFVDPDKQDFRVKKSAKEELGLDEKVLDEDFDITKIGMQRKIIDVDKTFIKTYPRNGDSGLNAASVQLSWQKAAFADEYDYVVAKDPEFKEVVVKGTTIYSNTEVKNLEKNTNYYWKVTAKNISRAFNDSWDADGAPYLFTTATYDVLIQDNLKAAIKKAEDFMTQITEGDKIGDYKIGTSDNLKKSIDAATIIANMTSGQQSMINNAEKEIKDALATAKSSKNIAYMGSIDTSAEWVTSTPDDIKITRDNNELNISKVAHNGIAVSKDVLPECGIYTFEMKTSLEKGWFAFSLRHSNYNSGNIYSTPDGKLNNYFFIVKKDVFELQSRNSESAGSTLMITAPNNGIFKENEWNRIEMGAIPMGKGVLCVLKVNGQKVYEFLDEVNPVRTMGGFAIQPSASTTVSIRPVNDAPTGEYTPPENIFADSEKLPIYYATYSPEYYESGSWSQDSTKGYDNKYIRVTSEKGAYTQFNLVPSKTIKTYKVSYYHVPYEDGDKNVAVNFANLYVNYTKKLDMSKGEKGWVELGTFNFVNANAFGTMDIRFTASGQGKLGVSAVKIELVDDNDRLFSEIFSMHTENALLMKADNNMAYKDITPYKLDVAPVIINGRTLIPLRFVSEAFDGDVEWNDETQSANIKIGTNTISFKLNDTNYTVNNEAKVLDQSPVLIQDRTMVPLRALAEAIGKTILWDEKRSLILIADNVKFTDENREKMLDICDSAYNEKIDWTVLTKAIETAKSLLPKIVEGDEIGNAKAGTIDVINNEIAKAESMLNSADIKTNNQVKEIVNELNRTVSKANLDRVVGFKNLDVSNEMWKSTSEDTLKVDVKDNAVQAQYNGKAEGSAVSSTKLTGSEILTFDLNAHFEKGKWFAFGLTENNSAKQIYSANEPGYFIVVKEDVIELQGTGRTNGLMIATVPNNGLIKSDTWHNIEFGALPVNGMVCILLKVDGKTVFEYWDKEEPQIVQNGFFAFRPADVGNSIYIRKTENPSTGIYQISDSLIQ